MFDSRTFNALKNVRETLEDNYTSSQLLTVLDDLIFRALDVVIENSEWMDLIVSQILIWYGDEGKRRITTIPKSRFLELLFVFQSADIDEKKRLIRRLEVERNIWMAAAQMFVDRTDPVRDYELRKSPSEKGVWNPSNVRIRSVENSVRLLETGSAFVANRDAQYWLSQAYKFKSMILEKYMRRTAVKAHSYYKASATNVDLEDSIQDFIMVASKAIDKCSIKKGTLTSYIDQWLRSIQTGGQAGHEYGLAYTVPSGHRKKIAQKEAAPNIAVSMEAEEVLQLSTPDILEELEEESEVMHIRRLAKYADAEGFARLYLGIREVLTPAERNKLSRNSNVNTSV